MSRNFVNLNTNPCKMCMPIGGCLALKGVEGAMIMMHGSQGCSTYMRRHIATHYNEPIDIASSSLNEKETVYGGSASLKKGISNISKQYAPEILGVLTTCLAETIGEDIKRITEEFKIENDLDMEIITVATPGYGASQYEGYFAALKAIVSHFVKTNEPSNHINIISTLITPADQRALKRILELFEVPYVLLPDISRTLDAPYSNEYVKIPKGGTKASDIKKMGGAIATIEIGSFIGAYLSPGMWLEENHGVPLYQVPIPIGLKQTDMFLNCLSEITGKPVPECLREDRGRLLDAMVDSHKYNGEGRAAIFGDPEIVYSTTLLCMENGIVPEIVATGTQSEKYKERLKSKGLNETTLLLDDTDFDTIQKYVRERQVNLLIGNSDGKFIMEKEEVPLVRIGFPVHDQVGGQRKLFVGYEGTMRFLDDLTNTILDHKHMGYRNSIYETYFGEQKLEGSEDDVSRINDQKKDA